MSQLNVKFLWDFSDEVLPVEPWNKTPALICGCLQAVAEALKINASIAEINLGGNKIGVKGAKA